MEVFLLMVVSENFRADFVARNPAGHWVAIEVKTGTGRLSDNQALGYSELTTGGAVINSKKMVEHEFEQGSVVQMPLERDRWTCPLCHP